MIGLSTYSFFWQHSDRVPEPLDLAGMLERTRARDLGLFQICDYPAIFGFSAAELRDLRARADDLDITLELGTRGLATEHLASTLAIADALGATYVRGMVNAPDHRPTLAEAENLLRRALPDFERAGVTLALETYEQVSTDDLLALIETVGSDALGVCLDPGNCIAALERPRDVVERTAPYVRGIHAKDFRFTRRDGWVGFTLEGAEFGTGLLDYDHLVRTVRPAERGITQVVEHWLVWQGSVEETVSTENRWTDSTVAHLRSTE